MPTKFIALGVTSVVLMLSASLSAQSSNADDESTDDQSTPSFAAPQMTNQGQTYTNPDLDIPSQRPLTGVQELSLGNSAETHNFVLPSINVMTQLDTNPSSSGYASTTGVTYLLGHLDLYHTTYRSSLSLDYSGGEMFSVDGGNYNSPIQALGVSETFRWQRWSLLLADGATYLSQSPFGFGGVGGLDFLGGTSDLGAGGLLGGNSLSLNASIVPNQTISTGNVPRVSDAAASQIEYQLTPRSSWTAAGSYGLLRFFNPGYINSSDDLFQTGYNYQLSSKSTVGILYRFEGFRFTNLPEGINDHTAQLAYGRRVTERLSFQLAAGPDFLTIWGTPTGSSRNLSWTADTSLNYQFSNMTLSASYDHLPTSGSGVFSGAYTDQFQGTLERRMLRVWTASGSVGYAKNRSLASEASDQTGETFSYWYTAARISRHFGPSMTFFFAYEAYLQGNATAACSTSHCGSGSISNEFSLGFNWFLRPAVFQ